MVGGKGRRKRRETRFHTAFPLLIHGQLRREGGCSHRQKAIHESGFWGPSKRRMKAREERRIFLPGARRRASHGEPEAPVSVQSWWSRRETATAGGPRASLRPGTWSGTKFYIQTSPGRDKAWPACPCFSRENSTAIKPVTPGDGTPNAGIAVSCSKALCKVA